MIGVTCMTTAKGKNARSSGRHSRKASASATPPTIAAIRASKVMLRVTIRDFESVSQSSIKRRGDLAWGRQHVNRDAVNANERFPTQDRENEERDRKEIVFERILAHVYASLLGRPILPRPSLFAKRSTSRGIDRRNRRRDGTPRCASMLASTGISATTRPGRAAITVIRDER